MRRYAVRSRDAVQYSMETDTTFQEVPANIMDQLVEDRVLLRVYYKAGSYMTYQAEGQSYTLTELCPDLTVTVHNPCHFVSGGQTSSFTMYKKHT